MSKATEILTAAVATLDQRGRDYDQPDGERSMGRIVAAFNALTGHTLTEAEGWQFMAVLKLVRMGTAADPTDSAVDCAAYAALAGEALAPGVEAAPEPEPQAKGKKIEPDADGWIPWAGGMRPVDRDTDVEVRFCDGDEMRGRAFEFRWGRFDSITKTALTYPIIAYRLVPEAPADEKAGPWKPGDGEMYFSVASCADEVQEDIWANDSIDRCRAAFGNVFRTREEAEAKRAKIIGGK